MSNCHDWLTAFSVNVEFLPVSEISLEEETLLTGCERHHTAKPRNVSPIDRGQVLAYYEYTKSNTEHCTSAATKSLQDFALIAWAAFKSAEGSSDFP